MPGTFHRSLYIELIPFVLSNSGLECQTHGYQCCHSVQANDCFLCGNYKVHVYFLFLTTKMGGNSNCPRPYTDCVNTTTTCMQWHLFDGKIIKVIFQHKSMRRNYSYLNIFGPVLKGFNMCKDLLRHFGAFCFVRIA